MKQKKEYLIIIYTIAALLIDLLGRYIADKCVLPIWFDSMGTFLIAYYAGPVCGGVVGLTNNVICGIFMQQQTAFSIIGAIIGVIVGYFAQKGCFETRFKTMTLGMGLALFSTVSATLLKLTIYDGAVQNVWGDQVALLCTNTGFHRTVSLFLGQFCVEFFDKLVCVWLTYGIIHLVRLFSNKEFKSLKKKSKIIGGFIIFATAGLFVKNTSVLASDTDVDYNTYLMKTYSSEDGLLSGEANDIEQTKDGKLWIATYAGLYKYDGNKFKLFNDLPTVKSVISLYTDDEGRLLVGTNDNGLSIMINEQVVNTIDEEDGLLSNSVKDIISDSNGNYYIATTDGISIMTLNGGARIIANYDNIKNSYHMTSDRNGNVVAATESGDVFWMRDGKIADSYTDALCQGNIKGVCFTTDNKLLCGTTENTVYVYDLSSGKPQLERNIQIDDVETINYFYETSNKDIFICSDNGIAVLHDDYSCHKLNTDNFTSAIYSMLIDYQGNLWFSSARQGLLKMSASPFHELFPQIGIDSTVVNSTEIWNDFLFCGTDKGLIAIDKENDTQVENEITKAIGNTRVRCVKADSKNNLWIATTGIGLCKVTINKQDGYDIKFLTEDDGMAGMRFRDILELEDGSIAVSGDTGVTIIKNDVVIQTFTLSKGLSNEKSLCMLEYNGALYIGSDGGGISVIKDDSVIKSINKDDGLTSGVILRMVYDETTDGMFIITSNGLCYMYSNGNVKSLDQFPYSNNYDMVCKDDTCWILGSAGIYVAKVSDLIANTRQDYPLMDTKRGLRSALTANAWLCCDGSELYLCCGEGVITIDMSDYDITARSYRMLLDYADVDGIKYDISRSDTLKISSGSSRITFEPEVLNYSVYDPYVSYYLEGYDSGENVCLLSEFSKVSYADLKSGTYIFHVSILDSFSGDVMESANYTIVKEMEMYQNRWFQFYIWLIIGLVIIWLTWFITRAQTQRTILKQQYELTYAQKQIEMGNETILSIARAVDAKDTNTSQHSYRVSEYTVLIAQRLGYPKAKCESLRQMALLHDIGKIGIPDAILNKPGKLTDEEFTIMKSHVIKGGEILKGFKMIENVDVGALYHHEKYDGTGYCHGLKGEEIPIEARIIGIADAFDAMTANRVYRKQLEIDYVINEFKRCSGTQFDPKLVDILLSLIDDGTIDVAALYEKSKER